MENEEIIKDRIAQALKLELPVKIINFFHYNHVEAWPIWITKFPDSVPSLVTSVREEGSINEKNILVQVGECEFKFSKIKTGEDPANDNYKYSYWNYEVYFEGSYVFGIKIKQHWAGGKPEFMEIEGFILGAWMDAFFKLKQQCEELEKEKARLSTIEKRNEKRQNEELREKKFGLD